MRAALRDKRRATAIEREVEITLLRAVVYEWLPNRRVAPSAPEPPEGDSRVAAPPEVGLPGATSSEIDTPIGATGP
jgi:hypothetical protein